jgi:hypothetical protein
VGGENSVIGVISVAASWLCRTQRQRPERFAQRHLASSPEEATSDDNINGDNVLDADCYLSGDANDADDALFPTPEGPDSDVKKLCPKPKSRQTKLPFGLTLVDCQRCA